MFKKCRRWVLPLALVLFALCGCQGSGTRLSPIAAAFDPSAALLQDFESAGGTIRYEGKSVQMVRGRSYAKTLVAVIDISLAKAHVARQNIDNARAIVDQNEGGGPYIRKYVELSPQGKPVIKRDLSAVRTIYDPGHPHADLNGLYQAPDIDLRREFSDYDSAIEEIHQASELLKEQFGRER